ncbi:putative protein phosphatase 2C 33 [Hibiscus syriacus]|uniref:protein-serine/threonine phosphatase n=1 Tax=Hibiscus syriacus TaxID=106335 RepID=A0A6A2YZL3_HIBSY|nr:probable protein phosphatase 2C 33 [Hibiscus syriacus]XP_039021923.1 probable protein phosphatase 2C 33 [Hibiscus syriacus]XP_039021924.1 probable protein phosphatase 2C 33 [Hibiscus syriacus]KAE8684699.1 putative protein phosphatase 2C 33 [Hibiscus syriacus]
MGSCFSAESRSPIPGSHLSHSPHQALDYWKKGYLRKKSGSFDYSKGETLHRIPGRLFLNGCSGVASLYTQQGKKGTNQDAMIVWENFCSRADTVLCGVFDGHGPFGHMVAKKVRDHLPLKLSAHWEVNISSEDVLRKTSLNTAGSVNSEETALISADDDFRTSVNLDEMEKLPEIEIFKTLKASFLKAFKAMDRELRLHTNINCFCSGTTAVTLVKQGPYLVIGNVGDSRAVLASRDKDNSLTAVQLTVDLKPNLPAEEERIRRCKGRVFALRDEPTVARVWLPNNDAPGLAMARAFGDFCLKDFGLISVPEVYYRRLSEEDEFIVLATDGIWDVLSNNEVIDIVASAPTRSYAARALVHSAVRAWRYKYPTSKVDDCAVVCLFLDSNSSNLTYASNAKAKVQPASMDHVNNDSEKDNSVSVLTSLDRYRTVRTDEVVPGGNEDSSKSKQLERNLELGIDWSSLDGVSRVDTLLNLPRFVPGKEDEKARK